MYDELQGPTAPNRYDDTFPEEAAAMREAEENIIHEVREHRHANLNALRDGLEASKRANTHTPIIILALFNYGVLRLALDWTLSLNDEQARRFLANERLGAKFMRSRRTEDHGFSRG